MNRKEIESLDWEYDGEHVGSLGETFDLYYLIYTPGEDDPNFRAGQEVYSMTYDEVRGTARILSKGLILNSKCIFFGKCDTKKELDYIMDKTIRI